MNLEVSIWTAYLFFEMSGDTLVQLAFAGILFSAIRAVIKAMLD